MKIRIRRIGGKYILQRRFLFIWFKLNDNQYASRDAALRQMQDLGVVIYYKIEPWEGV